MTTGSGFPSIHKIILLISAQQQKHLPMCKSIHVTSLFMLSRETLFTRNLYSGSLSLSGFGKIKLVNYNYQSQNLSHYGINRLNIEYWYFLVIRPQILNTLKNQRGNTLGNRKFFCWGESANGVGGGQEPSKTLFGFFINGKIKISNLWADNQEVPNTGQWRWAQATAS